MSRPTWDEQFIEVAKITARRSTCDRAAVGCVIAVDSRIVTTGYNGALAGAAHCGEAGHLLIDNHCLRAVHAEANAIADAARRGVSVLCGTCYCTHLPCPYCTKLLLAAGVRRVVYVEKYGNDGVILALCKEVGVKMVGWEEMTTSR